MYYITKKDLYKLHQISKIFDLMVNSQNKFNPYNKNYIYNENQYGRVNRKSCQFKKNSK